MNVKQLKEAIKDLPDNMDVMIYETFSEFTHTTAERAEVEDVGFYEEPGGKKLASEKCLVIRE